MSTVLGIDAGGTTTRCVWLDETGRCLGHSKAGPGNPLSAGPQVALESLTEAIGVAMADSVADPPEVILLSMAGGSGLDQVRTFDELRHRIGFNPRISVDADLIAAYFSARVEPEGLLLLAGTGAVAGRIENSRLVQVSDGLGWLIGDEGSGFWIGREVVLAAVRAMDGRGPATALSELLGAELGWVSPVSRTVDSVGPLLELIYRDHRPVELSRFARLVLEVPQDEVAADIVRRAGDALVRTWHSVADGHAPTVTVLAGGVLNLFDALREQISARIGQTIVVGDGLVGAGVLALRALGVQVDEELRIRIAAGLNRAKST